MRFFLGSFLLSLALFSFAAPSALADGLPPETWPCMEKKAGDACTDQATGQKGGCVATTCTNAKPDGTSTSYACVKCVAGAPTEDDGGCTVGMPRVARRAAPWLLAGAFSLLFLAKRRRRAG
jgi:hypothetical protein